MAKFYNRLFLIVILLFSLYKTVAHAQERDDIVEINCEIIGLIINNRTIDRHEIVEGRYTLRDGDEIILDKGDEFYKLRPGDSGNVYYTIPPNTIHNLGHFEIREVGENSCQARFWRGPDSVSPEEVQTTRDTYVIRKSIPIGNGRLRVITNPLNARVFLDDDTEDIGTTYLERETSSGLHIISTSMDYYHSEKQEFVILPNEDTVIDLTLKPIEAKLQIKVSPSDADVKVNGKERTNKVENTWIFELFGGKYDLAVTKDGYYDYKETVEVGKDERSVTTTKEVILKKHAILNVDITKDGISCQEGYISIDNGEKQYVKIPYHVKGLLLGEHTIKISISDPNFAEIVAKVTLEEGKEENIKKQLARIEKEFIVDTEPKEGVEISTDEGKMGKTESSRPLILSASTGTHKLKINLEGYELKYYRINENDEIKAESDEIEIQIEHNTDRIFLKLEKSIVWVTIKSTPNGADIYIDDEEKPRGKTDMEIKLTTGQHRIRLRKEDFRQVQEPLFIQVNRGDKNSIVSIKLEPIPIDLIIYTDPEDATVDVNGEKLEKNPGEKFFKLSVNPGKCNIEAKDGNRIFDVNGKKISIPCETYNKSFDISIKNGKSQKIDIELKSQTSLWVTSDPAGINLDLGEYKKHITPDLLIGIKEGSDIAKVKARGYKDYQGAFQIKPNELNLHNIILVPKGKSGMISRSLIFPGLGLIYGEHKSAGYGFLTSGAISLVAIVGSSAYYKYKSIPDYNESVINYNKAFYLDDIERKHTLMNDKKKTMDNSRMAIYGSSILYAGIFVVNIIYSAFPGVNYEVQPENSQAMLYDPKIKTQLTENGLEVGLVRKNW